MREMTKYYLKNAALHPVHAFKSLAQTWFSFGDRRMFETEFKKRILAVKFAKENNFTREETSQLNRLLSSDMLFFITVGKTGKEPHALLFVKNTATESEFSSGRFSAKVVSASQASFSMGTPISSTPISQGYVVRAKANEDFPKRVDAELRTFTGEQFNNYLREALSERGVSASTTLKLMATGNLAHNPDLKSLKDFFNQPFFGTP